MRYYLIPLLCTLLLAACGGSEKSITADQAKVEYDLLYDLPKQELSFDKDVLPVLEKRCVVCHGCYDAPCQLKLTSSEGVYRGANKDKVYDGSRITAADPTRLFVDAMTTAEWRTKKFSPVLREPALNESGADKKLPEEINNPVRNLEESVMYRMLRLKQLHPQARTGMLSDKFDLSLNRKQSCPTIDEFDKYSAKHPEGGMPFALPNLSRDEHKTLVHWIAQGAPVEDDLPPSASAQRQIKTWESFLNGGAGDTKSEKQPLKKQQLVSRYIYEHLFQGHLHFAGTDDREFYRLVRSSTPPGQSAKIINTRRPYDASAGNIYYRLLRIQGSIVAKNHVVYPLSEQKIRRYKKLFYDVDYQVEKLPSYDPVVASNPIKAFADIPVRSRYKFLLDDARFFIEGFIKGPVCRGQIALNVIEDQFWIFFVDPDAQVTTLDDDFLRENADKLAAPTEAEDTLNLLSVDLHYKSLFRDYMKKIDEELSPSQQVEIESAMKFLWDGRDDSSPAAVNRSAALTVFRHLDSASVNFGLLGDYPSTSWVMGYSVLERIHYLLVAGYDVYGNIGHQLNTRLYMDLLRSEGENNFLVFMPVATRHKLIDDWYQGARARSKNDLGEVSWIDRPLVKGCKTDDPQRELYQYIEKYLGKAGGDGDFINRCGNGRCVKPADKKILRADLAMQKVEEMDGVIVQFLPDLAYVRVLMGGKPEHDRAYSLIYNKAYKSVSNILQPEDPAEGRDYAFDTQTILPWLEGSYPSFFFVVKIDDVEQFTEQYSAIDTRKKYEAFVMRFGVRRTSEDFWKHADWFNQQYRREQPVLSGIFDLNRYQNR